MIKISRLFLFGSLILVLLTAACAAEEGTTPTLVGTSFPAQGDLTSTPLGVGDTTQTAETETTGTATESLETPTVSSTEGVTPQATTTSEAASAGTSQAPGIPVTGLDVVLVECQFCVDTIAHALLVLPDTATFEIVPSASSTTTTGSTTSTLPNCSTVEVNNGKQVVLCSGPEMTPLTLNICTNANTCTVFPIDLLACPLMQSGTAVPNKTPLVPGTSSTSTPSTITNTPTP